MITTANGVKNNIFNQPKNNNKKATIYFNLSVIKTQLKKNTFLMNLLLRVNSPTQCADNRIICHTLCIEVHNNIPKNTLIYRASVSASLRVIHS